ncbi:MAG: ComF family protein [Firmicutes bacterium]|nr:ComF family protein [Bacillota bacterium]
MLSRLLEAALELIFPPPRACPLCETHSPQAGVCMDCRELLAGYAGEQTCSLCGCFILHTYPAAGDVRGTCAHCGGGRPFDLARSVGPYEGPLREAVHRLKYRKVRWLARPLAALMSETVRQEPLFQRSAGLVPVPLSPDRENRRGFNQAALLAGALGEITGIPVLKGVAARVRETPPQTCLSRRERLRNLEGAFAVTAPHLVKKRNITIVDDVYTTGSTVSILSQELRQAGTTGILVITFAGTRQTAVF